MTKPIVITPWNSPKVAQTTRLTSKLPAIIATKKDTRLYKPCGEGTVRFGMLWRGTVRCGPVW